MKTDDEDAKEKTKGMLFRVMFILEDGRKVYATKRGNADLVDYEQSKIFYNAPDHGCYLPDLSVYGPVDFFTSRGLPVVRVVGLRFEHKDSKPDEEAFILGGMKYVDAQVNKN